MEGRRREALQTLLCCPPESRQMPPRVSLQNLVLGFLQRCSHRAVTVCMPVAHPTVCPENRELALDLCLAYRPMPSALHTAYTWPIHGSANANFSKEMILKNSTYIPKIFRTDSKNDTVLL